MLQNFLKIYPKTLSAQMVHGELIVQLVYALEQYGVFTGPFDMVVRYQPDASAQAGGAWTIVSNAHQGNGHAFERFFKTLELYLQDQAEINPLQALRSGGKQSFEMHFPKMHCDLYAKGFDRASPRQPVACAGRWGGAGVQRAHEGAVRSTGRTQSAQGMGLLH